MIRLELTLKEAQRLHQCVSDALLTQGDATLLAISTKLTAAEAQATQPTLCPVCHQWFSQDKTGRSGQYCSAACKQRAYRQRRQAWRKQFRPTPRT
jgi:hypothetical protein